MDENNHHFSFVELGAETLKTYSYNRLMETLSESSGSHKTVLTEVDGAKPIISTNQQSTSSVFTGKMTIDEENAILFRNICIWTPIGLGIVVFFSIYLMWNMTIPKSTILYATYVTNKVDR